VNITTDLPVYKAHCGSLCSKIYGLSSLVVALMLSSSLAHAQSFRGQPLRLGETTFIPEVRLDYVSIDNAFNTSINEQEASGFIVAPAVEWEADRRLLELNASYRGRYGSFSESALNFTDHDLRASLAAAPAKKHRTAFNFRLLQEAEEFGTGQAAFVAGQDDQVVDTSTSLSAGYTYGARDARGNIGAGFSFLNKSYNDLGTITDGDDYTAFGPFLAFSYRISADTRLLVETRLFAQDYDADSRDRNTISFLVGADLEATDRTGGRIRLGLSEADFDAAGIEDRTTFVADVDLYYRPRQHSRFDLSVRRDLATVDASADGVGESVRDDVQFTWAYGWTSRFSTRLRIDTDRIDRVCPNIDTLTSGVSLNFDIGIRRWLSVGAGAGISRRTADACDVEDDGSRDYQRNSLGVHVTMTL